MSEMPEIKPVVEPSENAGANVQAPAPLDIPEGLVPPAHVEKINIISPDDDNDSVIPIPLTKQVIEVIAKRKGFYGQQRIKSGDTFSVESFESLGEWMTCTDPEMEKRRAKFFKDKKQKAKK